MASEIDKSAAEGIAIANANSSFGYPTDDDTIVIVSDQTVEKEYGWVFFYNTASFVNGGDVMKALLGNGPILVTRQGEVIPIPSALGVEEALDKFKKGAPLL